MKNIFHLPSRSKCRLLWAKQAYSEIIKNYESFPLYRETFINGIRKQELNALYLTSLLHLGQEDKVLKERWKILALKESNLLPFFLELNKFSIETMHITANNTMAKALDAIQAISCFEPIDIFWKEYCRNKNIAIVGNAPIETRKGSDINNCDLVLRFNNFRISGYEVSLGNRTDAWCHICDIRPLNSLTQLYESINIDILTDNPLNTIVGNYFLDSTLKFKKKIFYIPQKIVRDLTEQLNAIPSSGIRILTSLNRQPTSFNINQSIFGFSFTNAKFNKKIFDHYFETKTESKERSHNINNEVNLLKKMFRTDER